MVGASLNPGVSSGWKRGPKCKWKTTDTKRGTTKRFSCARGTAKQPGKAHYAQFTVKDVKKKR